MDTIRLKLWFVVACASMLLLVHFIDTVWGFGTMSDGWVTFWSLSIFLPHFTLLGIFLYKRIKQWVKRNSNGS